VSSWLLLTNRLINVKRRRPGRIRSTNGRRSELLSRDQTGLTIEAGQNGAVYNVRLSGELDHVTCGQLEPALLEAEASPAIRIVLDLDGLVFVDSTGLQAILKAKRRAEGDAGRLTMTRGTGEVAEMFRLTGLDLVLPFA
jgi:anti-sigma B factor antagonist